VTRRSSLALAAAVAVILLCPHDAEALGDTTISAGTCGVAAGGSVTGNTVTCNFGLTPEQLREVTQAAVTGATASLAGQIADISGRLGVTENAAKTLLRIVGERDVPNERLAEALSQVAADYKRLRTQVAGLNPDNPTARALVADAQSEITAGHLAHAHGLLRQATQAQIAAAQQARKLREQAREAEESQLVGAAGSMAAEADVAMTERQYLEAADLFQHAAETVPAGRTTVSGNFRARQANALYRRGYELGDNDALKASIEVWRQTLPAFPRNQRPLDWAVTQNNLGDALEALGERESKTTHLEDAVAAYRAALEERRRDRVPLDWAITQNNLGFALFRLGERETGTAHLEEAAAAYRAALEERTRDRAPLDWATTQTNLGSVLVRLGEREAGTEHLQEAVAAFRAALAARPRDQRQKTGRVLRTTLAMPSAGSASARVEWHISKRR
jgi:tetratricopeptide (TPR) repeat protein